MIFLGGYIGKEAGGDAANASDEQITFSAARSSNAKPIKIPNELDGDQDRRGGGNT